MAETISKEIRRQINHLITETHNYKEAKGLTLELLKNNPDDIDLIHTLASIKLALNEINETITLLNKIKSKEKDNEFTNYFLANSYIKLNDKKGFLRSIMDGLNKNPNHKDSYKLLFAFLNSEIILDDLPFKEELKEKTLYAFTNDLIEKNDLLPIINKLLSDDFSIIDKLYNKIWLLYSEKKSSNKDLPEGINEIYRVCSNNLFLEVLKKSVINNINLELFSFKLKVIIIILEEITEIDKSYLPNIIKYLNAFCFQNILKDSIWIEDKKEKELLKRVRSKFVNKVNINQTLSDFELYLFYSSFSKEKDSEIHDKISKKIKKLDKIFSQFLESNFYWKQFNKKKLKKFESKTKVENKNSKIIEEYYNRFPSSHWSEISTETKISFEEYIKYDLSPGSIFGERKELKEISILDVGCGTGRETLLLSNIKNSNIDAIDLSERNLVYSINKSIEHKIRNINFLHMDILDIEENGKKYDFINISNTLDEYLNYEEILQLLNKILKPRGFIRFGLRSKIAHKKIMEAKKLLAINDKLNLDIENLFLRDIRKTIVKSDNKKINFLVNHNSFYQKNEFIHLMFPINEPFFTITKIKHFIEENNLKFLGWSDFVVNKALKVGIYKQYEKNYPDDLTMNNLENWNHLENEQPFIFSHKYSFWAEKQ
tara:strand:- start:65 stop:2035 length:1971 start_codon:yes stop_codon:yes gene_type:complete